MGREKTLALIEGEWRALMAVLEAVPPGARSGSGEWSVRELMSHISTWEREFLKALPVILAGERLPHYSTVYGGIDAFNALEQERARALSLVEVRRMLARTHAEILSAVSALPAQGALTEARLRRRLRQDTYQHYRLHTAGVQAAGGPVT